MFVALICESDNWVLHSHYQFSDLSFLWTGGDKEYVKHSPKKHMGGYSPCWNNYILLLKGNEHGIRTIDILGCAVSCLGEWRVNNLEQLMVSQTEAKGEGGSRGWDDWLASPTQWTCCCPVPQSCPTLCNPMDCSIPGFSLLHFLLEFAQTHVHWVSDAIQPSHPLSPLLLLLSVFPSIRVFFSESVLPIRWPKYWSFSISPSNAYSGLISFRIDWLDLAVQVTRKSLLQHHSSKVSAQTFLWSNCHIHTWLLEKPLLCLYGPLLAKWCLCFLVHCIDLS